MHFYNFVTSLYPISGENDIEEEIDEELKAQKNSFMVVLTNVCELF